jgi:hypothetical protein
MQMCFRPGEDLFSYLAALRTQVKMVQDACSVLCQDKDMASPAAVVRKKLIAAMYQSPLHAPLLGRLLLIEPAHWGSLITDSSCRSRLASAGTVCEADHHSAASKGAPEILQEHVVPKGAPEIAIAVIAQASAPNKQSVVRTSSVCFDSARESTVYYYEREDCANETQSKEILPSVLPATCGAAPAQASNVPTKEMCPYLVGSLCEANVYEQASTCGYGCDGWCAQGLHQLSLILLLLILILQT